jgi:hypothetical protein
MADDLSKRQPQDASRINLQEYWEVRYRARKFGVPEERLKRAVMKVGNSAAVVEREIAG